MSLDAWLPFQTCPCVQAAVNKACTKLLYLLDYKVAGVIPNIGLEQEYFMMQDGAALGLNHGLLRVVPHGAEHVANPGGDFALVRHVVECQGAQNLARLTLHLLLMQQPGHGTQNHLDAPQVCD